ncbi:MAG: DUF4012 domain-containing protein [Actinomycetota bacterium]
MLLLGSWIAALRVRDRLLDAKVAMAHGKTALLAGNAATALADFRSAEATFAHADSLASGPVGSIIGAVPVLGRSVDTTEELSAAGVLLARSGERIASAVDALPEGIGTLAPQNGRVPLQRLRPLADAVSEASLLAHQALQRVQAAPDRLLLSPVGSARAQALATLSSTSGDLDTAGRIVRGLAGFLGAHEPRSYFFGAADPAELRGSIGLIGAYSILTIDDGRFHFSPFRPTNALPDLSSSQVRAPSVEFARNYDQFGGAGFWKNISMSPDFPSVARAIEATYTGVTGRSVDGVIVADPFALRSLLTFTGPEQVPQLNGVSVDEKHVVDFITNEAFTRFSSPAARQRVLGAVAESVFARFLERAGAPASVRVIAKAGADGHLLVQSTSPQLEAGFAGTPVGGSFTAPAGDFLSIVQNNGAGAKLDYYEDRHVSYAVHLAEDGSGTALATVGLHNAAPSSGEPAYVIGPFPGVHADAGENVAILNLYCAPGCTLDSSSRNGAATKLTHGSELGQPFFQDYFRVPSGETSTSAYRLSVPDAWEGNSSGGTYRMTFSNQVTVRPTRMTISVEAPPGMHITSTSLPMRVDGGLAIWEGTPGRTMSLEVSFQPSLPLRLWRDVGRIFARPVLRT